MHNKMPAYGRKRMYKRKAKKPWYNQKYSVGDIAQKALSTAKYVKSLINVEKKFIDITQASTAQSSTPTVSWLTNVAEGTDYNQRTGISLKAVSLLVRGVVQLPQTVATSGQEARCIIFTDMDNQSATPAGTDLLEVATDINSPLNHTNVRRFKILFDRRYTLDIGSKFTLPFKYYRKMNDHIRYSNSTTGAREGQVYILTMSDTATATNEPAFSWYSRIRFIDN